MNRKAKAQKFKDKRMERMTGKKSMPNVSPVRDPRKQGMKNPAKAGEAKTNLERRVTNMSGSGGTLGARPQATMGTYMPGMLNN